MPVKPPEIEPLARDEKQAARAIGMSVAYLRASRLASPGNGRTAGPVWTKLGKRSVRYRIADLDAWLVAHRRGGESSSPSQLQETVPLSAGKP